MSSLENGWMGLKSQEATLNEIEELKKKNRGAQRKFESMESAKQLIIKYCSCNCLHGQD